LTKKEKGGNKVSVTLVKNVTDLSTYEKTELIDLYKMMVKIRTFDANIIRLITEGKITGFYHSGQGHEAIAAGVYAVVNDDDYVYYAHRGCNVMIAKGVPLIKLYGDFLAREIGTTKGLGAGIVHSCYPEKGVLGQSGTLGESFVLAPGTAYASKLKKDGKVVLCHNGDGTHAREVFHGGMNFSALHKLPIVFICENNGYAISAPLREDHAIKEYLAERAEGYGIPAYVVDGKDVLAVREIACEAVERARRGDGPIFIECIVRRLRGHYEGDPITYIDPKTLEEWNEKEDPVKIFKTQLAQAGVVDENDLDDLYKQADAAAVEAIEEADRSPLPPMERLYEGLFSKEV
jgi:pyruvate dehydrogenase E1 component alpha subunit